MNSDKKWVTLNNGAKMPTIGMGTWHHGPREEIDAALRFSLENGYRHIDCAKIYLNEKEVGQVFNDYIGKSIAREDLFIIGKLWGTDHHPDHVEAACRRSLADLNIEYFDSYLIHWPSAFPKHGEEMWPKDAQGHFLLAEEIHFVDTWKAMEKLVMKGLCKSIGLSNFNSKQIQELLDKCFIKPTILHAECNPRFSNEGIWSFCRKNGIQMIAYSPFGSPDLPWGEKMPHILADPVLTRIAAKYKRSTANVALRWLLQRGLATIPKSVIEKELLENMKVFEFGLDEKDMKAISALNQNLRKIVPINKVKSGEIILRDGRSRHYPFTFEEPIVADYENEPYVRQDYYLK